MPPLVVFAAVIALWEISTAGEGRRVIPPPSAILDAGFENFDALRRSAQATAFEALGGLVIGTVGGILVAFTTARWVVARDVLLPVAIATSAIPIIAVAPILNNWFGVTNPLSKMAMAALLVFFPILINVTRGLVEVQPASLELMRSYAASEPCRAAQSAHPEHAALPVHGAQGGCHAGLHWRDRGRVLRRHVDCSWAVRADLDEQRPTSTWPGRAS